jgi:D-galacturonate reductase
MAKAKDGKLDVVMVGGGMITHDQLLPSIYHLQRLGVVGTIKVCALNAPPLRALAASPTLKEAFPTSSFESFPDFTQVRDDQLFPDLFKEVIAKQPPRQCVVVAVPDQMHYGVLKAALAADQHVLCVKPLVLKYAQAVEIEKEAHERGLVIGVEYHKRFDDRALMTRQRYRAGLFGEFMCGQSRLIEPWYYRHSNFQNWLTLKNSDAFTYIGCHYVDLVAFITGLKPVEVSVYGNVRKFPNGNDGFLWTDARVIYENGGVLNVENGLGYTNDGPGGNSQGMRLFCEKGDRGGLIDHSDDYRGVSHGLVAEGLKAYEEPSPDFFRLVDVGGGGLTPVGYGYRSVAYIVNAMARVERETAGLTAAAALKKRRTLLEEYDREGIMATPQNSAYNELVMEAGRLSILHGGRHAKITYGPHAAVAFKPDSEFPDYSK